MFITTIILRLKRLQIKNDITRLNSLSQSYGVSLDHTVLPATQHKWTRPALTPARGQYSIYLPQRDGQAELT